MRRLLPPSRPASQPPRVGVWLLLCLLVALLPLRPLASWAMAPELNPASATARADAPPCHGHAGMAGLADQAGSAPHDPAPAQQAGSCSACDLCHAAMAGPVLAGLGALPAPRTALAPPVLAAQRPAPADGPFRPPRG